MGAGRLPCHEILSRICNSESFTEKKLILTIPLPITLVSNAMVKSISTDHVGRDKYTKELALSDWSGDRCAQFTLSGSIQSVLESYLY